MKEQPQPGLFIGIDWADQKHDCYVIDRNGKGIHQEIKHSPEDIDTWVGEMLKRADGKPIAIMLEQSRGPLVHALMFRENVLTAVGNAVAFGGYDVFSLGDTCRRKSGAVKGEYKPIFPNGRVGLVLSMKRFSYL